MTQSVRTSANWDHLDLAALNQQLEQAHPRDILAWASETVPTGLVQSSAFNADDMAITHMLYRELQRPVPVLFLDTLHHFEETLSFVERTREAYGLDLRTYKNLHANSRAEFAQQYGEALWESDVSRFHELTKVEPLQRGLSELGTLAWITGRRRDQAPTRANMPVLELDDRERLKINPLARWTSQDSWTYVMNNDVLYNPLHDRGYLSIGDEPLTTPVNPGESERAGRWRGLGKTECGIHL
ncbi:MAG: phosphoadenosine phosphosulfate reductase [Cyanobacteria bacterium QS_8_64_29]|nr:MAG: phosphoadenosine phosphosulfate reductase [Cyanobacteria bacterium QS_8_64_29]